MLEDLLLRKFNLRTYNCWDLTREVWLRLTGYDLGVTALIDYTVNECGDVVSKQQARYEELPAPHNPCIVLMQRPKHIPHVGVWYKGRVFHIRRAGAQYVPLEVARLGFTTVRYYVPCCTK